MNRNKLITLFISNLANVVVHKVLERAIDKREITEVYTKEVKNSWEIAKAYREKMNPVDRVLPAVDIKEIREKIVSKVKAELRIRIERGYTNIDLSLVDVFMDEALKEMGIEDSN